MRPVSVLTWLDDPQVGWLMGVHEHRGTQFFVKEAYERLLWWMALRALLDIAAGAEPDADAIETVEGQLDACHRAAAVAAYRVEALLQGVAPPVPGGGAERE